MQGIAENQPCILVAGVKRASSTPGPHGTAFALLARSRVPVLCVPRSLCPPCAGRRLAAVVRVRQRPVKGPIAGALVERGVNL